MREVRIFLVRNPVGEYEKTLEANYELSIENKRRAGAQLFVGDAMGRKNYGVVACAVLLSRACRVDQAPTK